MMNRLKANRLWPAAVLLGLAVTVGVAVGVTVAGLGTTIWT